MNIFESYPQWLLTERDEINDLLRQQIVRHFRVPALGSEISRCLIAGRKIRSIIFRIVCADSPTPRPDCDQAGVMFAIECAHAASVLVDDILDQDSYRHGYLATQAVWGAGKSALVSHLLVATALATLSNTPHLQHRLTAAYGDACWGEAHDVMLVPGDWINAGYSEKVFSKTSALFRFAFEAAGYMTSRSDTGTLQSLGEAFGRLYQYANDYYDWQPESLLARHEEAQNWPVTFSLPLAVHLHLLGDARLGDFRSATLSYKEWLEFLDVVWQPPVRQECEKMLRNAHTTVTSLISAAALSATAKSKLSDIAALANTYEFWFHELRAA